MEKGKCEETTDKKGQEPRCKVIEAINIQENKNFNFQMILWIGWFFFRFSIIYVILFLLVQKFWLVKWINFNLIRMSEFD